LPEHDSNADPLQGWCPDCNPWLIAAAVMLPTFMEVLDTAIASVALPHIAGSLSATTDEATWVLTSYLVANAIICRPVVGFHCASAAATFCFFASWFSRFRPLPAVRPLAWA